MSGTEETKDEETLNVTLTPDGSAVVGDVAEDTQESHEDEEATAKVDEELAGAATEEDREAIRERRRNERKSRSQRQRAKVETLEQALEQTRAQLSAMQQQMSGLQSASTGSQLAQVDALAEQADKAAEHFKGVIADAVTKGDGRTVAEATEYLQAARSRAKELRTFKENAVQALNAPAVPDAATTTHAQTFLGRNRWYQGPASAEPDSQVLTLLDNALAREGWQPNSPAYWQELERRAATYLPHRMKGQQAAAEDKVARSPVAGSSGGDARSPNGSQRFTLSPARVAAIKDAGKWDDAKERDRMIRAYRDYDKNQVKG